MKAQFFMPTVALSVLALGALAQEPEVQEPEAQESEAQEHGARSPKQQVEALLEEFADTELGRVEAYEAFRPRFEALAAKHRGTEAEVTASLWLLKNTWWLRPDGKMEETAMPIAEDLLERHADSPQLGSIVDYKYVFGTEQRESLFQKLFDVTPLKDVKAWAQFGLAQLDPATSDEGRPNEHFALLLDEYKDCPWRSTTMGDIADAHVNPHSPKALEVGETVPDIVGIDEHDNTMKLSDFRGSVVLLDFWGDW